MRHPLSILRGVEDQRGAVLVGIVGAASAALGMGFVGGFLPAARAARMKIVDALRAA